MFSKERIKFSENGNWLSIFAFTKSIKENWVMQNNP